MSKFKETVFQDVLRFALSDTLFAKIALWTTANQVECSDGKTVESKIGKINGISDSLTGTSSNIAVSQKALSTLSDKIDEALGGEY